MDGRESPEFMKEIMAETNVALALKGMQSMPDESMGGSADVLEDGRVYVAYNFSFSPESGEIREFITPQQMSVKQLEHPTQSTNVARAALVIAYDLRGPTVTQEAMQIAHDVELSDPAKDMFKKTLEGLNRKLKAKMV